MLWGKEQIRDLSRMGNNYPDRMLWRNARMASGRYHGQVNVDVTFLRDGWKSDHRAKRLLEPLYRNRVVGSAPVRTK